MRTPLLVGAALGSLGLFSKPKVVIDVIRRAAKAVQEAEMVAV